MKKLTQKVFVLFVGALFSMPGQSAMIGFSSDSSPINIGETLEISIVAEDFAELSGGVINFRIDSPSLSVEDVVIDSFWDFNPEKGELEGDVWEGIGFDVNLAATKPLSGSGVIARISVIGEHAGFTTITLLGSSEFFSTSVQLETSEILDNPNSGLTVQVIPLPASIWFMGSALFGLVFLRRKVLPE